MFVAHSALLTYNAALNGPAFQSSVQIDSSTLIYAASLANDGSRETNVAKNNTPMCSVSQRDTNPWWAVDLGSPTTVHRVDLTNRGEVIML